MKSSPKQLANLRKGGPGRPKGLPNKANRDMREAARALLEEPAYLANLRKRLKSGRLAPPVETMLYAYGYGKPKETLDVNTTLPAFIIRIDGEGE